MTKMTPLNSDLGKLKKIKESFGKDITEYRGKSLIPDFIELCDSDERYIVVTMEEALTSFDEIMRLVNDDDETLPEYTKTQLINELMHCPKTQDYDFRNPIYQTFYQTLRNLLIRIALKNRKDKR